MDRTDDFMDLFKTWDRMPPGPRAELRRVNNPRDLLEVPAFYRLYSGRGGTEREKEAYQRLIFCLPCINAHTEQHISLGQALAKGRSGGKAVVSEKRLFQVLRSMSPNDMIQLRRILKLADPTLNWPEAAKILWYWNDRSKRDLLEDFFLHKSSNTKGDSHS